MTSAHVVLILINPQTVLVAVFLWCLTPTRITPSSTFFFGDISQSVTAIPLLIFNYWSYP